MIINVNRCNTYHHGSIRARHLQCLHNDSCMLVGRYKFVGEAGALALLQGMYTKNNANLEANASLFSKVCSTPCACLTQRQQFLAARKIGVSV